MSKYPKSWPVGGHAEAEAKVRQLQKIGTKWLRASGPGWVAEKQGRLSNIKFEDDPGFILLMFEAVPKSTIAPPWRYATVIVTGDVLPSFASNELGSIYRITYTSGLTDFAPTQVADADWEVFERDVTATNTIYIKRFDENNNPYYDVIGPSLSFPSIPAIEVRVDTAGGGLAWYSTVTGNWVYKAFVEPVLTGNDYTPTKHTVFLDPKSLALSKYETTYAGVGNLGIRRDVAVADRQKKIYFMSYLRDYNLNRAYCFVRPKDGYPDRLIDFNLYTAPDQGGYLTPLSPWHLYLDETGFVSVRESYWFNQNAKVVRGSTFSKTFLTIKSEFEHVDPLGSSLVFDLSTFDVFDRKVLAADSQASFNTYTFGGEKVFAFKYHGTSFGGTPQYELPIGMPKAGSMWKSKVAAFTYKRYDALNENYEWVICGWDTREAKANWLPGTSSALTPTFEFVARTKTSNYAVIGLALRENKIFLYAIEYWIEGDATSGTANVNRPVVFVYKWGGELIKKIDLMTELELSNLGCIDGFLAENAHAIYASPF